MRSSILAKQWNPDAPRIHDEPEYVNFADSNPEKNLAAEIRIDIGDVEKGFAEADEIFEAEYEVPKVQQAHIEPHVCVTYWDEDDRLVIRTSTQVPFHVRRMLAPVLNLPVKRIRVIKPRIGGGFGGKQEVLMEDVPAHLTIATKRPVIYEYTREEEFIGARSRHPMQSQNEDGREAGWNDHSQFDVCVVRHGRIWLSRVDRHRQYRSQGDGFVCRRWRISQGAQHPLLRGCRVHQYSSRRRVPWIWRATGILAS